MLDKSREFLGGSLWNGGTGCDWVSPDRFLQNEVRPSAGCTRTLVTD